MMGLAPPSVNHTRFDCGSTGGLFQMLCEVANETHSNFQVCDGQDVNKYHERLERSASGAMLPEPKHPPPCGAGCINLAKFMEAHSNEAEIFEKTN